MTEPGESGGHDAKGIARPDEKKDSAGKAVGYSSQDERGSAADGLRKTKPDPAKPHRSGN